MCFRSVGYGLLTPQTSLETRRLGSAGPEVSVVGFGAWAIGGGGWAFGWGHQEDDESVAAIRHALAKGVTWIDTAAVYGRGHSEEVVARALADVPASERPHVFTKCGLRWGDDPFGPAEQSLRPDSIRYECEQSLRRLRVERIDLYQFHWPDKTGTPVEESWGEMSRLVDEGKVRWAGVSNFDVGLLERCERIRHVDSLQPPFSLLTRDTAGELLGWCREHGTGVIVYSPMESGLLTGAFTRERVKSLPDDDWRRSAEEFNDPMLSRNLQLVEELKPIAERHGVELPALVVAWCLAWRGVTAAIVGARRPSQVDGWLPAGKLELTDDDLRQIQQALERLGVGSGPTAVPVQTATRGAV